ncbi:alpha/beta fold hydrolase [uncultured Demequina sp.]|uniref:alpha/beta fold hydrolase n=1 Tax=uncultured Demequina sp. TaxID=693499 RepID=UPI0025E2737B|nr:alpha/beta hydrolase [uncultured Demequina sp.]
MTGQHYRTLDVAVDGGDLRVGVWEPDGGDSDGAVVLIHGVTASHLAFAHVVPHLSNALVIAPDLRGRGRSAGVGSAAGMAAHADDIVAALDALGVESATVVGHSMGGFVAMVLAHRHPDRVARTLLVDGGLPLDVPANVPPEVLVGAILGPTAERLSMRFADLDAYLDYWRPHPAFAASWDEQLEAYFAYDLVPEGEEYRAATSLEVTVADTADMIEGNALRDAIAAVEPPMRLVTVGRGLLNEEPGLYAPDYLERVLADLPAIEHQRIDGFNHYTIVMSPDGGRMVAALAAEEIEAAKKGALA